MSNEKVFDPQTIEAIKKKSVCFQAFHHKFLAKLS